jgi:hypothetical protein
MPGIFDYCRKLLKEKETPEGRWSRELVEEYHELGETLRGE